MLQEEHSAILLTFIKLPFVIKIFVWSIFEWPLKTGFTVFLITTDELSDLRGQVKLLEDKNTKYMQENIEIQEVRLYRLL